MTRFFELAIACRMNFGLPAGEHILRRHIADGAVQAHGVVVLHVGLHQAQCIFPRQRCAGPNALRFERLVPARQLAVGLRIVRRRSHMRHPCDANELLEIPRDELRSVVGDDPGFRFRIFLPRSLQKDFDFRFGHRFPQIPMHDRTAIAIQNAAPVVEGAAHVAVGNINVPMLMRLQRLLEAGSFARRLALPSREQSSLPKHAPATGR